MATSKVYFSDLRSSFKKNLLSKLIELLEVVDLKGVALPHSLVAVKLHFGESGNLAFIRPNFIRCIVDYTKELGAFPFLTDTNTLYAGTRANSVSHLKTAIENGFAYSVVNAPIIIADGLRGGSYEKIRINKNIFKIAYIGKEIFEADTLISVAHFKGHEVSGFGGTIKNLAMGCASRKGKLQEHSELSPKVNRKRCEGCGDCVVHCPGNAISLKDEKAFIDQQRCIGCGECVVVCPNNAINIRWSPDTSLFQKKMAEYAFAVLAGKKGKAVFLNFLINISPACDCAPFNDAPIVRDLGIMASIDPVAIDQASVDMINREAILDGSCLAMDKKTGDDKFKAVYPNIDWSVQLEYAEEIGLGRRYYELITI